MRRFSCPICGKKFASKNAELEHFKNTHVGKLTSESIQYLKSLGVSELRV